MDEELDKHEHKGGKKAAKGLDATLQGIADKVMPYEVEMDPVASKKSDEVHARDKAEAEAKAKKTAGKM